MFCKKIIKYFCLIEFNTKYDIFMCVCVWVLQQWQLLNRLNCHKNVSAKNLKYFNIFYTWIQILLHVKYL